MDIFTPAMRSKIMRGVRSKHTKPELAIRRLLFGLGYRYRTHAKLLPGKPDIVFSARRKVVFVNGCFWHQHPNPSCPISHRPASNVGFWNEKLDRNLERDKKVQTDLQRIGWSFLVIWECEFSDLNAITASLQAFLGPTRFERFKRHQPSEPSIAQL